MKTKIMWLCLMAFTMKSMAQPTQPSGVFTSNTANASSVIVKWYTQSFDLKRVYHVYRQSDGGEWQKLNTAPVGALAVKNSAYINAHPEEFKNNPAYLLYNFTLNQTYKDPFDSILSVYNLAIGAVSSNAMARCIGMIWMDSTAVKGKTYVYKVTMQQAGKEEPIGQSNALLVDLWKAPAAPANVMTSAGDRNVSLKWTYDPKFPVYKIYRANAPSGKNDTTYQFLPGQAVIDSSKKHDLYFFTDKDTTLQDGKTYYYRVSGIDFTGQESLLSEAVSASPKDLTPPRSAQAFQAAPVGKNIVMHWKKTRSKDCVAYAVMRSATESGTYTELAKLKNSDSTYTDKNTGEGKAYYYYVEARDQQGNGSPSNRVMAMVRDQTPPQVPQQVVAVSDTGKIIIRWKPDTDKDLRGYYLFRALKNDPGNFNLLNKYPVRNNLFTDTLPKQAGNFFIYKLCAVDSSYNRSDYSPAIEARMPDVVAPVTPSISKIGLQDGKVILQWARPADPGLKETGIYRALCDSAGGPIQYQLLQTVNAATLQFADAHVAPGHTYFYTISTTDSAGNQSAKSVRRSVMIPAVGVQKPTDLLAVYDTLNRQIHLSWKGEAPGFQVYRRTDNGNLVALSSVATALEWNDQAIAPGHLYQYVVKAIDQDGGFAASDPVRISTQR